MMRRAWLLIAIAAGIPAAAAQERPPAWMAACPPFCDPSTLFGNSPRPVPVEKKKPHPVPAGVENDAAGGSADVPFGAVPGRESEAHSTMPPAPAWVDEMDVVETEPSAREATVEEKDDSQGANSPRVSVEENARSRSPLPRGGSGTGVPDEPVLERPTTALKTARETASPVPTRPEPPRSYAPAELERPTEALKVPLPPRKPAAVPAPKRRSPEKKEIAAAPVAAPVAKKAAPKAGKKGRDSLIKPVEPIFDPRYPADAMVKTPFGMTDMTRDGFEIKAFDSRNRVLLQKGSAIALCRFDSVELPVTGGSYVGNSECYVTQRPIRP